MKLFALALFALAASAGLTALTVGLTFAPSSAHAFTMTFDEFGHWSSTVGTCSSFVGTDPTAPADVGPRDFVVGNSITENPDGSFIWVVPSPGTNIYIGAVPGPIAGAGLPGLILRVVAFSAGGDGGQLNG
jgi:hypothetical protein